jgi:uncharacterized protein YlzI (FlbEa/FlbD family)
MGNFLRLQGGALVINAASISSVEDMGRGNVIVFLANGIRYTLTGEDAQKVLRYINGTPTQETAPVTEYFDLPNNTERKKSAKGSK